MIFIQILLISWMAQARVEWHERNGRSWVRSLGLEMTENLKVVSVKPGSYSQMITPECGGIRPDDVILTANGKKVSNLADFEKVMKKSARRHAQLWSFLIERPILFSVKGQGATKNSVKDKRYFVAEVGAEFLKSCDPVRLKGCGPTPGSKLVGRTNKTCEYRKSPRLKDRI